MAPFRSVLALPRLAPLLAVAVLARLPIGVNALALVLFLRAETGSFAVAGGVAGALALGTAAAAPLLGRLIDRAGVRVLVPLGLGHAGGLVALLVLGSGGGPTAALVALGALTGASAPPVASVLRARYPALVGDRRDLLPAVFALDSVLLEVVLIGGPLLVAALVALTGPAGALVLSATAAATGTAAFVALLPGPHGAPPRRRGGGLLGALRSPALRALVAGTFPVGMAFGAIEVALPAFADDRGAPEVAGLLVAALAVGSMAGGLAYGARARGDVARAHRWITFAMPFGLLPAALATSPWVMALLVLPAGLLRAPFVATRNELAGAAAPPGAETEAYTWALTALVSGVAAGQALAGALADASGWRAAVLLAAGAAALGSLVAAVRGGRLGTPPVAAASPAAARG